jgi:hypothetical protein
VRLDEQGRQPEHETIERRQIRRAQPRTIADQYLMLEYQRLSGNGANSTGAQKLHAGDEQMDRQCEQIAHGERYHPRQSSRLRISF